MESIDEAPVFVVIALAGALGAGMGYAIDSEEMIIPIAIGAGCALLALFLIIERLKTRADPLEDGVTDENRTAMCKKAKKLQQDFVSLDPFFPFFKPQYTGLWQTDVQKLVNDVCNPAKTDEEEEEEETPVTLKELAAIEKAGPSKKPSLSDKNGKYRTILLEGFEEMQSNLCAPFEANKASFDEKDNDYKKIVESCDSVKTRMPMLKKFADFDLQAEALVKKHAGLKGEGDAPLEYAKTNKDTLKTDASQLCAVAGPIETENGAEDLVDYADVYKLLVNPDVDACKKDE